MRIEPYWVLVSLSLRARADVFRSTSFKCIGFDEGNNCRLSYSVKTNLTSPAGDKIENRPFSRRRHMTRTTRIYFFFFLSLINWSIPLRLKKRKPFLLKKTTNWSILVVVIQWRHRAIVLFSESSDRREGPSSVLFQDPERLASEMRPPALQARFLPVVLTAGASLPVRLFARTKLNKCQLKKLGRVDLLNVRTSGTFLAPPPKAYLALDPLS